MTNKKRPRTGKELWKIAKQRVLEESSHNIAKQILRMSRELKTQKKQEDEEKLSKERAKQQMEEMPEENRTKWDIVKRKIKECYQRQLIEPTNRKLKNFHLIFFFILQMDFLLTGWVWSNYEFHHIKDIEDAAQKPISEFMDHKTLYTVICSV